MTLLTPSYIYDCTIIRVVDGDTIDAELTCDVGFRCRPVWRFRLQLLHARCPSPRNLATRAEGQAAAQFTSDWLAAEPVVAVTHRPDGWGRWLADIRRADGSSLAAALVEAGLATPAQE